MIKTKNKQIYKQTNKQTKQINIFRSYISQPNQVGSSRNFQGIFLWVFQDDLNKKNKPGQQKNKQTNKQINSF